MHFEDTAACCRAWNVEFIRRKGCCLCFGAVYRQAAEYLRSRSTVVRMPEAVDGDRPLVRSCNVDEAELLPVLDMAGYEDGSRLKAESAATLAELAHNDRAAASLCTSRALETLRCLLQADEAAVAYPAARALSRLSARPEAGPHLADGALLAAVAAKARSEATELMVRRELARALGNTIETCAAALSVSALEVTMHALAGAQGREAGGCARTWQCASW
mmetsp:Transcript_101734/g.283281  ORF Transcript_101734/g.283281 Transcript_101734/m.283281 type:complete len:219 (-) Transcript_101734:120-776(-)